MGIVRDKGCASTASSEKHLGSGLSLLHYQSSRLVGDGFDG